MLEFLALGAILAVGGWILRNVGRPAVIRWQLSQGIISLRTCTVEGNDENIDGVSRKLSAAQAAVYRPYLEHNSQFIALFKYGTDTGPLVRRALAVHLGPVSGPPFSYEAFDLSSPNKYFDTSYPYNESIGLSEFVRLVLSNRDRWRTRA